MLQEFNEANRNLIVNINGRLVPREEAGVSPFDFAVQGGDAVWEGLRLYNGRIFKLHEHLARLRRSASALSFAEIPPNEKLIDEIRATGARIRLIGDGDLSAGIAAAVVGTGVHAVMGTGGAPEGVLTAAAMRCLNGEIFARLVVNKPEHEERCRAMGITDFKKIYRSKDLASGERLIFAATGVTDGTLMRGVRFFGDGTRTTSLIMQTHPHQIRFIDSIQVNTAKDFKIQF